MEMVVNNKFLEMNEQEMMDVDGGNLKEAAISIAIYKAPKPVVAAASAMAAAFYTGRTMGRWVRRHVFSRLAKISQECKILRV